MSMNLMDSALAQFNTALEVTKICKIHVTAEILSILSLVDTCVLTRVCKHSSDILDSGIF